MVAAWRIDGCFVEYVRWIRPVAVEVPGNGQSVGLSPRAMVEQRGLVVTARAKKPKNRTKRKAMRAIQPSGS
jgi:hypothetical protein